MRKAKPVESHIFDGMETAVTAQAEAAALYTAEELTKRLLEDRQSIDRAAGEMERDSPLFFGQGENPSLF